MADQTTPDHSGERASRATGRDDPTVTALRTVVHTDLLPLIVSARRHLHAGDRAAASHDLDRVHELARGLLRSGHGSDGAHAPGDVLVSAVAEVRERHPDLEVAAGTRQLPGEPADPVVQDTIRAIVVEAGANATRHRRDGRLAVDASGDDRHVDVVARSTGAMHPAGSVTGHRAGGMGLHLLRQRVRDIGGTLQVLHDETATVLVASLPRHPDDPDRRDTDGQHQTDNQHDTDRERTAPRHRQATGGDADV